MDRIKFLILSYMDNENINSKFKAIKVSQIEEELKEQFGYTNNYVHQIIRMLLKEEKVKKGFSNGHAFTYYITKKGQEYLEKIRSEE